MCDSAGHTSHCETTDVVAKATTGGDDKSTTGNSEIGSRDIYSFSSKERSSRGKKVVLPRTRARRQAKHNSQSEVFAVRTQAGGQVFLSVEQAKEFADGSHVQSFAWSRNLDENIRDASEWIRSGPTVSAAEQADVGLEARRFEGKQTGGTSEAERTSDTTTAANTSPSGPVVRLPNARERRAAKINGSRKAFGVRTRTGGGRVFLSEQQAKALQGEVKVWDVFPDMARNIKRAAQWVRSKPKEFRADAAAFEPTSWCLHTQISGELGHAASHETARSWTEPATGGCQESKESEPRLVRQAQRGVRKAVDLKVLLSHRQVSNVQPVSADVRQHMDSYRCCEFERMTLDLRGKSACQVQRDLRKQLVRDLEEGVDEAAFVCKQLGISMAPRADQLELMIAAMPGLNTTMWKVIISDHMSTLS